MRSVVVWWSLGGWAAATLACASTVGPDSSRDATRSETSSAHCTLPNGAQCGTGEQCPAGDGCNVCSCGTNGLAQCTLRACPPLFDAGSDSIAPSDASGAPDANGSDATPVTSCGVTTCGAGQLCVRPCCSSPGCNPQPPFCFDPPSSCAAAPECPCFPAICRGAGGGCGGVRGRDVLCVCF